MRRTLRTLALLAVLAIIATIPAGASQGGPGAAPPHPGPGDHGVTITGEGPAVWAAQGKRVGDEVTTPLGHHGVIQSVSDVGYGVLADETTCLGDLIDAGVMHISVPDFPHMHGPAQPASCGRRPLPHRPDTLERPDSLSVMEHSGMLAGGSDDEAADVTAAQYPTGTGAQQTWMYTNNLNQTGLAGQRMADAIILNTVAFNVGFDFLEYLWVGGRVYNYLGNGANAFFQIGVAQSGSQFSDASGIPGGIPTMSFAAQYRNFDGTWSKLTTDGGATPVGVQSQWDGILMGRGTTPTADVWLGLVSGDSGATWHTHPLQLYMWGPNLSYIDTVMSATEETNAGSGTRPPLQPAAFVGLYGQTHDYDPLILEPTMRFFPAQSSGAAGSVCPDISRVYAQNIWSDFWGPPANAPAYCPNGVVW